jgi:hypothetical protein
MSTNAPSPDAEHAARLAWLAEVRGLHRVKRMLGFAGIILGASMLFWWKLDMSAPDWALWAGVSVLVSSWALFVYVIIARYLWVKKNPFAAS